MQMQQASSSSSGSIGSRLLKPELKAYAKVDAKPPERHKDCVPVMVTIKAPPGTEQRAPVDLVIVLHVREGRRVPKNWKELLTEAMGIVIEKLDDKDRMAVVPGGSTLMAARTFGCPQVVTSNTPLVRALESAESILYGRENDNKKTRAGYIIVISNSNDDMGSLLAWRFRLVQAFGFRGAHNARTMHSISGSRNCAYAVLDDEQGHITGAFFAGINRITSTIAAMPIEIKLKCEQKMVLSAIDAPGITYYISPDKKAGLIWPSTNLVSGLATNFVVYLGHLQQHDDLLKLFTVHVKYGNLSSENVDVHVVTKVVHGSIEVAAEIVRTEALNIVADIIPEGEDDWRKLHEAADHLRQRWETTLQESDFAGAAGREHGLISGISAEMREMETRLYNNYFWLDYMLSWKSHQRSQLPLPMPFMNKQSTNDPLVELSIFAKVDPVPGTTVVAEHQKVIPVLVQVRVPEAGLAKVKRPNVDLIMVLDASNGAKEMEKKTLERLNLLIESLQIEEPYKQTKKMEEKFQKRLQLLDKKIEILETIELMEEKRRVQDQRNQKILELNKMAKEMEEKKTEARGMKGDLEVVMDDTKRRLLLLSQAMELVMNKLSDNDRLACVPVQSYVTEPEDGSLQMSKIWRKGTSHRLNSIFDQVHSRMSTAWEITKKTSQKRKQPKKPMKLFKKYLNKASKTQNLADVGCGVNLRKALMDAVKVPTM